MDHAQLTRLSDLHVRGEYLDSSIIRRSCEVLQLRLLSEFSGDILMLERKPQGSLAEITKGAVR